MTDPRFQARPRFQGRPKTRLISAEEFAKGWWVYADGRRLHVGYIRIAVTSEGQILVEDPQWEEAYAR